ncbi:MAG TPA: Na+/H+ antiporter NhaA [Nitrococcus sp.]|nr:Na+/H+ antiporter NhaA [Nitrococcus sp.]
MSILPNRLQPSVDADRDHILGPPDAPVTLVEYGDYQCPYCRRAHPGIKRLHEERLAGQMRYVFRHFPNTRLHPQAQLAAEAAEAAAAQDRFQEMHQYLLDHQDALDRESLVRTAAELGLDVERFARELDEHAYAERVNEDFSSARRSGARATPTFFINGRRYDGPWDEESLLEAIEQPLGLKIRLLAQEFAGLSASAGLMLIIAAVLALIWVNSPWGESYTALWETELAIAVGGQTLALSLHDWINDGLIVIFFFVVGLGIKRELTTGELAEPRRAVLPLAAAAGGMLGPALIYLLLNAGGPWAHGWGVPISTDTAFVLGLLALLGRRVPLSLRVFVATLAIADDVGAILVLALFYTESISWLSLGVAAALFGLAVALNRARVYRALPYALIGVGLWLAVLSSGVHPTLAGVLLALVIPTRSPPNPSGLLGQSVAVFRSLETPPHGERDESRYQSGVRTLETVVERMLSPAQRLERNLQPWSSYLILPLFALANAGITLSAGAFDPLHPVTLGVVLGLVVGKPLGITLGAWLAVRARLAEKPEEITWGQLAGAACLCGIGFTMSIFIASAAFTGFTALALMKLSVMLASVLAGVIGWVVLRSVYSVSERRTQVVSREAPAEQ